MKDRGLDEILDRWAEYETASAPDLSPTPAMYQAVRTLKQARRPALFFRRWLALSAAAAALLMLAIIYPALFGPSQGPPVWSGREREIVGLREMHVSQKDAARAPAAEKAAPQGETVSPKRGKKGPARLFGRLEFQFRTECSPAIVSVDFRGPREEAIGLTSADSYRLLIEPADDLHAYVFQLSPSRVLVRLFPNETYGPDRNPLRRDLTYYLPPEPNWFHPGPHKGAERMYLLASSRPLAELERLYAAYREETDPTRRSSVLSDLLQWIEQGAAGRRADVSGWMFEFQHR